MRSRSSCDSALRLRRVGLEAVEELHRQHARAGELAIDLGEDDVGLVLEVGGEGLGVVGLAPQIHLALRIVHELPDHLAGAVPGEEGL